MIKFETNQMNKQPRQHQKHVVVKFRKILMGKPLEQQLKANLMMFTKRKNNKKSKRKILHRYFGKKRKIKTLRAGK